MRIVVRSGTFAGSEFEVDRDLVIGRSPASDIVLSDESISGRHAQVRPAGSGIEVADLGSTNGTFVRGQRIGVPTLVQPGETFTLARTAVEVVGTPPTLVGNSSRPRLIVRTGNDAGKELSLTADRDFVIGRGPASDLRVGDPRVSDRNASVRLSGNAIEVTDLGSANGTLLDGRPIHARTRAEEGAEIQVGETVISFALGRSFDASRTPTVIGVGSDASVGREVIAVAASNRRLGMLLAGVGALALIGTGIGVWQYTRGGNATSANDQIAQVVRDESPATVRVVIYDSQGNLYSSGSGSIINLAEGLILTNNHVIADGRAKITSDLLKDPVDAELVGTTPCDDLAVIRVANLKNLAPGLKQVKFGDPSKLQQGEQVVTLGYPGADETFADIKLSTTSGIISKTQTVYEINPDAPHFPDVIQTDAPINHGNSGGPMFNLQGEQIGVNSYTSARQDVTGQNYAISVGRVEQVLPTLESGVSPTWFGLRVVSALDKNGTPVALAVDVVYPGSVADKLGFKGLAPDGSIQQEITQVNGQSVKTFNDYCTAMPQTGTATLTVISANGSGPQQVKVQVGGTNTVN